MSFWSRLMEIKEEQLEAEWRREMLLRDILKVLKGGNEDGKSKNTKYRSKVRKAKR